MPTGRVAGTWVQLAALALAVALAAWTGAAGAVAAGAPGGSLGRAVEPHPGDAEVRELFERTVTLGVPREDLEGVLQACRAAGFTTGEAQRVLRLIMKAKLAGLPHMALLHKLREGLAKGAGPDAIEEALERKAQTLRKAKSLVDTLLIEGWAVSDYPLAVQIVTDALEAGAEASGVLHSVREDQPCRPGVPDVRRAFLAEGPRK